LTIQVQVRGDGLAVSGELDMASADDFREFAKTVVEPTREVALNVADLEFVDTSGVRAILRLAETACPNGSYSVGHPTMSSALSRFSRSRRCREYEYSGGRIRPRVRARA
jgi:ABC-type transporter Mla MlaB component